MVGGADSVWLAEDSWLAGIREEDEGWMSAGFGVRLIGSRVRSCAGSASAGTSQGVSDSGLKFVRICAVRTNDVFVFYSVCGCFP